MKVAVLLAFVLALMVMSKTMSSGYFAEPETLAMGILAAQPL